MRSRPPWSVGHGPRRSRFLAGLLPISLSLAVVAGLAAQPQPLDRITGDDAVPAGSSPDWNEVTAAEQLREDQCLMSDVLRLGGPAMTAVAQDGLNQPPDKLRELANRDYWEDTPLATAYTKDRDAASRELDALNGRRDAWAVPLDGLETPGGFTVTGFHWPPGSPGDDEEDFYSQTGLTQWVADRFWKSEDDFYEDPTPPADEQTVKAVKDLGTPLYTKEPDPHSPDWDRDLAERDAFEYLTDWSLEPTGADNARLFLASGGFPRTAPSPGSAEYRIAVEDLKTRFASCAWRDPIDPNEVLGGIAGTAATEWQEEVAAQAGQRDLILDANEDATKALAAGAKSLGEMLGNSWVADHLVQWQDYWSSGGVGWIGDSHVTIEVPGAKGNCLDVAGGGKTNGTPVQIYTCNGGAAQQWTLEGSENDLHLRNVGSQKCLDVAGNASANGTKIQISDCYKSKGQSWKGDVRATAPLKSVTTGKCLDLSAFTKSTDARLWDCKNASSQKFLIKPSGHQGTDSLSYPDKAQFDKAKAGVNASQVKATKELALLKARAAAAQKAVTTTDTAEKAAYAIADERGAPRGRGLLVGQQKAQVTKGAAAALEAMVKAGETAEAATRAAAGDSATIMQRALAQAAQSKAEFRREAAHAAELQAKASADAAKLHRDNAKKDKETAEAKLAEAVKAEGEAKTAAAEARAERLAAEAEEKTAEAEKKKAAAKQAEAAEHRKTAETEATKAKDAKDKAEAAEGTASDKRDAAVKAKDKARELRDDAWDAEQKADAARAKADAKEAYAQAHESDSNAQEARAAADAAAGHADDAEAAATKARSAADAATKAAADADAAATRAEAAAKRARAHADGAQAAKLKADAALKTATSAAADAIQAAKHAASEAKAAVALAAEAEQEAKTAKNHANEASKEAAKALVASAKAAGFAHVTAQAAVDAGNSAAQVAKPANDAIQLGSPYVTTDSAASLVVLTGQASKSIAEQQKAVAEAHAKNAQAEASAAKNLADQAVGDSKQAYVHAANAAGHAADARGYAKEALGYAADAATAASKAAASLARTVEYDRQATEDAEAADKAAGRAESHATDARDSADEAALDAEAARTAASEAEEAARDARAAADRADVAATEAEEAAKDALKYAEEAQEAAESAERKQANQQVSSGAGTGIGGTFYVVDEDSVEVTDAQQKNDCVIEIGFEGCTVTFAVTFDATVDFFLCTDPDVPATSSGCPAADTVLIKTERFTGLKKDVTHYFSKLDLIKQTVVYQILKAVLVQDFVDCWHGSASGCAWAASNFIPGKAFAKVAEAINALDAALKTGIGVADAFKALKALDMDPASLARIEAGVNAYEDVITTCRVNSFPGDTPVLMADGTRKAIRDVREGDLVMAASPGTGRLRAEPVTDTFRHDTERLVTIGLAGGSSLDTTAGHKIRTSERGWVLAAELRPGDRLLSPDGTLRAVTDVHDRPGLAPRRVYDLTVDDLHTFYVRTEGAQATDVMVHNCLNLGDEDLRALQSYEIHTLKEHVRPDANEAFRLAREKGTPNTVWTSQEIAQQAVDRVVGDYFSKRTSSGQKVFDQEKWKKFQDWAARARDGEQYRTITGKWDAYPSLGKRYHPDGMTIDDAGNEVVVILMKVKNHNGQGRYGFVVKTAYPK